MPKALQRNASPVRSLLDKLTLREKILLLSGKDNWSTAPIPRLGIPSLITSDGPHGVRTDGAEDGRKVGPATSFPTGIALAATWNPDLLRRVGGALADECLAYGVRVLLGPCINIVRTPLAGRNFETYGEDPYLSGRLAIGYIRGVQGKGVAVSLKHFACNNQEHERLRGSSEVDERTLREIYLPAFETAVKEARPWTVMCAYNRVNGAFASENAVLLTKILRDEWKYGGLVMSDWGAVHSTLESLNAGLDLEMPGPAMYFGNLLFDAVRMWKLDPAVIDRAAARVLKLVRRAGKSARGAANTPPHRALARKAAEESIVLLKNDKGLLPLKGVKTLAVIGPCADDLTVSGGGSAELEPPYRKQPLDELRRRLGRTVRIVHEKGCINYEIPPLVKNPSFMAPAKGKGRGLLAEYFAGPECRGKPVYSRLQSYFLLYDFKQPPGFKGNVYSVRWSGFMKVKSGGRYQLVLQHTGTVRAFLNGKRMLQSRHAEKADGPRWNEARAFMELEAGRRYFLRLESHGIPVNVPTRMMTYFGEMPSPAQEKARMKRAAALAARSGAAVVFAGMSRRFEGESFDRPYMRLPGPQDRLIEAVAKANPNTVVSVTSGSPVSMPWVKKVRAVLACLYPGQEGGAALANILLGKVNPSGKLPVTFPRRYEDNPSYKYYPGDRAVRYGEGIFVGYRQYDKKRIAPLFPFGHGLSYTKFEYGDLKLPRKTSGNLKVSLTVKNIGQRTGAEVVQVYVGDVKSGLPRPVKELKGFKKVFLRPGQSARVDFTLDRRSFAFYHPGKKAFVVEPGEFTIMAGSSSRDIRLKGKIRLSND